MLQALLFCHLVAEYHIERDGKTQETYEVPTNELKRISRDPPATKHKQGSSSILSSLK